MRKISFLIRFKYLAKQYFDDMSANVTLQRQEVVSIGNLRFVRKDVNYAQSMDFANQQGRRAALGSDINALNQKDRRALENFLYGDYKEDREHGGFAWLGDQKINGRPSFRIVVCYGRGGGLDVFGGFRPELVARWVAYVETAREAGAPQIAALLRAKKGQTIVLRSPAGNEIRMIADKDLEVTVE